MAIIPWSASAAIVRPGGSKTQVGTLLGCVRAWNGLTPSNRHEAHIECRTPVFHDGWSIALKTISAAKIPQLFALL